MASHEKNSTSIARAKMLQGVPWCDEYERMISGMAYCSWESSELAKARAKAVKLCEKLNESELEGEEEALRRQDLFKTLFGQLRDTPILERPFSVLYGCNTSVGSNFYGNSGLAIDDSGLVSIGDDVLIGPNVHLITINHSTDVAERLKGVMYAKPISIGSACWIGARATILPGANIGYGCTIGAGSVVSGRIPDYSIAVGVPARVVRSVAPAEKHTAAEHQEMS